VTVDLHVPTDRFEFQRFAAADTTGIMLNVGCHSDGAGLKKVYGDRVVSCDLEVQPGYEYEIDVAMDARKPWPFPDDYAEMAFLCDILEHLYDHEIVEVLRNARRVSHKLCATVPNDRLWYLPGIRAVDEGASGYRSHCNEIDETKMRRLLSVTGWWPVEFIVARWVHPTATSEGYYVICERTEDTHE
jgi:predicted SAM-dependent methyltransferase